jgi:predicted ATP-grasp superfamily ATP-dependent carboligase
MKLLLLEHITATCPQSPSTPAGLLREGSQMLQWLVRAHGPLASSTRVMIHPDWAALAAPLPWVAYGEEEWQRQLEWADAVLAVAPESDGILLGLAQQVNAAGVLWLGCSPDAIALATSKWRTTTTLQAAGIASVPTHRFKWDGNWPLPPDSIKGDWVTKPDDGCGCLGQLRHDSLAAARAYLELHPQLVLQPWLEGLPKSLCLWVGGPDQVQVLAVSHQNIQLNQGQPQLISLAVAAQPVEDCHRQLAAAVVRAIPGLAGMVGIDFMEGPRGLVVLEVNPRMTTSFTGLGPFSIAHYGLE